MTHYNNVRIVKVRHQLRIAFGGRCCVCGKIMCLNKLEFAHVKETKLNGRGRGRHERVCDIIKNPLCYALMCYHCHLVYDWDKEKYGEHCVVIVRAINV